MTNYIISIKVYYSLDNYYGHIAWGVAQLWQHSTGSAVARAMPELLRPYSAWRGLSLRLRLPVGLWTSFWLLKHYRTIAYEINNVQPSPPYSFTVQSLSSGIIILSNFLFFSLKCIKNSQLNLTLMFLSKQYSKTF